MVLILPTLLLLVVLLMVVVSTSLRVAVAGSRDGTTIGLLVASTAMMLFIIVFLATALALAVVPR